jgi:hypothetical protein
MKTPGRCFFRNNLTVAIFYFCDIIIFEEVPMMNLNGPGLQTLLFSIAVLVILVVAGVNWVLGQKRVQELRSRVKLRFGDWVASRLGW